MVIKKPTKEQAPAAALSQGLRQHLGRESGDLAGVSPAGSRQEEKGLQGAMSAQGLQKPRCLLPGRRRSFQPLGLQLSQPPLLIWLQQLHSIPKHAPGGPACSGTAGRDVGLGCPMRSPVPCVRQLRSLQPDFYSGRNYSLPFPSGCRRHLGCFFHRPPEEFPSRRCQQQGWIHPLCPQVQGWGLFAGWASRDLVLVTFQVLLVTCFWGLEHFERLCLPSGD